MRFVIATIWFLGVRGRKMWGEGVGPRPKPLPQASKNRIYKRAVGVVGEKGLEDVDVDGSFDGEKVCVRSDGIIRYCIFQL